MKKTNGIPAQDLMDINKSFESGNSTEIINKGASGEQVSALREVNKDPKSYALKDYRGRILKHRKSVIPKGEAQVTVGVKGQKFEDIPEELRKRVSWEDSDFE